MAENSSSADIKVNQCLPQKKRMQNSIDQLPDELLISIVSVLPLKETARTCVTARRWRNLWKFSRVLKFDMTPKMKKVGINGECVRLAEGEREIFTGCVNSVLNSHLSETIDEFTIIFELDSRNANDIDSWIAFALRKKVRHLELQFEPNGMLGYGKIYNFLNIFQPVTHGLPSAIFGQLASLVSLRLTRVSVTGEVLELFISNCPFLEELYLVHVLGLQSFSPKCPAIRLKKLWINIDRRNLITRFEIWSPNLVSFELTRLNSSDTSVVLNGVSSLIHLELGGDNPQIMSKWLFDLSRCLSRLETLQLFIVPFWQINGEDPPLQFPNLPRVRRLKFIVGADIDMGSLLCFIPLINSTPSLHRFTLTFHERTKKRPRRQARRLPCGKKHQYLKVLEMEDFSVTAMAVEMVIYVLENAPSLEKMMINGKVVAGEELDLLKAKLGSKTCVKDITSSLFRLQ